MEFNDRKAHYPNRKKLTPVPGQLGVYDMTDVPSNVINEGTPLNARTFTDLKDIMAEPSLWYSGVSIPTPVLGKNGDYFLLATTSCVYKKESGAWVYVTSIKGMPGSQGQQGPKGDTGVPGPQGPKGDMPDILNDLTDNVTIPSQLSATFFKIGHPVDSILETYSSRNPASYYQAFSTTDADYSGICGRWVAFAKGRVLAGFDSADADFNSLTANNGAKTVTLGTTQIPSHNHTGPNHTHTITEHTHTTDYHYHDSGGHTHANAIHTHAVQVFVRNKNGTTGISNDYGYSGTQVVTSNGARYDAHYAYADDWGQDVYRTGNAYVGVSGGGGGSTSAAGLTTNYSGTGSTGTTGGSGSHNNLQPYQVVYIWRRIA